MTFKLHIVGKSPNNKPQKESFIKQDSYVVCEEGVMYCDHSGHFHKLCDLLIINQGGHKKNGKGHYITLEWQSFITKQHGAWKMPLKLLAGDGKEIWEKLLDEGLRITPGIGTRTSLMEYIQLLKPIEYHKPLAEYADTDCP